MEALQGDRLELENLHAVLAEAQTRADALDEIVRFGREATEKQTEALVNRGAALLARAAADAGEKAVWQERVDAGRRQQETLRTRYAEAKTAEAEARRLLELLTPAEQELFRKRYLEGYTAAELGKMYGLPPATVRTRLAKARRYLSQLLMEE